MQKPILSGAIVGIMFVVTWLIGHSLLVSAIATLAVFVALQILLMTLKKPDIPSAPTESVEEQLKKERLKVEQFRNYLGQMSKEFSAEIRGQLLHISNTLQLCEEYIQKNPSQLDEIARFDIYFESIHTILENYRLVQHRASFEKERTKIENFIQETVQAFDAKYDSLISGDSLHTGIEIEAMKTLFLSDHLMSDELEKIKKQEGMQ